MIDMLLLKQLKPMLILSLNNKRFSVDYVASFGIKVKKPDDFLLIL